MNVIPELALAIPGAFPLHDAHTLGRIQQATEGVDTRTEQNVEFHFPSNAHHLRLISDDIRRTT